MNWIFGIILLIIFELIADVFSKEYALKGTWPYWLAAIAGYIVANAFWLYAIRGGSGLARGAVLFSVGSAVFAVLIGIFIFKETVYVNQIIGTILGIIALFLISWHHL